MRVEGLVSVIVPIYNVEQYLNRCVDSIINQTYKNLEIILVDDGSPDKCGQICDEYALKDSRIVVIHKENGGLSDARNAGIEKATGEYLSFVDSDDWIEPEMIETLYNACISNSVKMACAGMYYIDNNDVKTTRCCPLKKEIVSAEIALSKMFFNKEISYSSCDKIYYFTLFDNIKFPKDKLYEDLATIYKCIILAGQIAMCNVPVYRYCNRTGSITKTTFSEKKFGFAYVAIEVFDDLKEKYPNIMDALIWMKLYTVVIVLSELLRQKRKTRNLYKSQYNALLYELKSTKKMWKRIGLTRKMRCTYNLMLMRLYGPLKRLKLSFFKGK
jgi:glycosyltransferase involved in cell wall biosynthesis